MCMFVRSLFVLFYFFFWPLCCLFFFNIRILIAPLVSSNSSYKELYTKYVVLYCNKKYVIVLHLQICQSMWSMTRKEQLKYKDCRSLSQMTFVRLCNMFTIRNTNTSPVYICFLPITLWPKTKFQ